MVIRGASLQYRGEPLISSPVVARHVLLHFSPARIEGHLHMDQRGEISVSCTFLPSAVHYRPDGGPLRTLPFHKQGDRIRITVSPGSGSLVVEGPRKP